MYIPRWVDLENLLKEKSYFLFGPRQTGKTCLIRHNLKNCKIYDLLDSEVFLDLSREPKRIEQELSKDDRYVVIDEIQKLPVLLDEVHRLIEKYGIHFLLTGSSARKLRKGGVNLLGGRARSLNFHSFVRAELKERFSLKKAINNGLIPSIYLSKDPQEDIKAYVGTYLQEEIVAESLTRNITAFSRFLQVAALCNGLMLNYSNIANDAQVPKSTVQEYFQILRDTLIGYDIPAWKKSINRKPIVTSKFYFFDGGIVKYLRNIAEIKEGSPEFGFAFETYIAHELKTYVDYTGEGQLCYWRSKAGHEVDFIINDDIAIEVKAKKNISQSDMRGILALKEENIIKNYVVISFEKRVRTVNGIKIMPWEVFLDKLWENTVLSKI